MAVTGSEPCPAGRIPGSTPNGRRRAPVARPAVMSVASAAQKRGERRPGRRRDDEGADALVLGVADVDGFGAHGDLHTVVPVSAAVTALEPVQLRGGPHSAAASAVNAAQAVGVTT